MANSVLLIEESKSHAEALGTFLARRRAEITVATSKHDVPAVIEQAAPEIIIADPYLSDGGIVDVLKEIKTARPLTQIIIISDSEHIDQAMEALGDHAAGCLSRPVKSRDLSFAFRQAQERLVLEKKLIHYRKKVADINNAQTLYRQLFDEVPCYITVQDLNFRLTTTNKLFKKDFGDEIGSHCFQVYKHRSTRCRECPVAATFKDGRSHSTEEIVTSKTGEQYNVITWTAPIYSSKGDITQVMEISTNITQIRQLQDHLTSLGLMLGSMSHGVKGMLTALDGGIYRLESGLTRKNPKRVQQAFEQVKQMAERIKKMVLEILYYAKSRELNYQAADVAQLSRDIIDTIKPAAEKDKVRLEVEIQESLGTIEVDSNWVRVALVNILENAIDACGSDHHKSEHQLGFKAFKPTPERLCYIIDDNGMGMDQETKEKLFTLFFSSKGSRGTGLGLFIAHHVIQQHGGTLQVESKLGEGSKFQICLPVRRPTQPRQANSIRKT